MNEAVFRFRATGDVDIDSLAIDYGSEAPSEEWCHYPYVLKVDDPQDNLYELRFPLSPFNIPENGSLTRTCTVTGPIYVIPRLRVPVVNVNLRIEQVACLDKLNCEDLLNLIEVYVNSDDEYIGPDGGTVEVERNGHEPYFTEELVSIVNEHGESCSWARFDDNGNVIVDRRYFDNSGDEIRTATAMYKYTYTYDAEINTDEECIGYFEGPISQRARRCDEADIQLVEKYTTFPRTGDTRKLTDIVNLVGQDASAFEIRSINDISAAGDAFVTGSRSTIRYSSLCGYTITTASNSDENTNLLEDKVGFLTLTYHNKYLSDCTFTDDVTIRVTGISCEELLDHVHIAIRINDTGDFITSGDIDIDSNETSFTVYILGDGYADYFDINEDECVIPSSVAVAGSTFTIPANEDPFLVKTYRFNFVAGIIDEEYREYSTYGCSFEKEFNFRQEVLQEIEEIGSRHVTNNTECETIEEIPTEYLEYEQTCT